MNETTTWQEELTVQVHQARDAYIEARVAALKAADAETAAHWAYQQAINRCINHGVSPL
jgi:hypothetical protein